MSNKFIIRPYLLHNPIKKYAWGAKGKKSYISQLLGLNPEKDEPLAELWMGAHPKSPSNIRIGDNIFPLSKIIEDHPLEILGGEVAHKFYGQLPFLFKLLSIDEPLSIQAHPNKEQAVILHKKNPDEYPDENHKIEIALAITELSALVGFKPVNEIIDIFKNITELQEFLGSEELDEIKKKVNGSKLSRRVALKDLITLLTRKAQTDELLFIKLVGIIEKNFQRNKYKSELTELREIFLYLYQTYGADIGLIFILLLNPIKLKKGEAVFTSAGIPHLYLKGNIIECMTNSDNVVRAGLTPKHKDVESLIEILTYESETITPVESIKDGFSVIYNTPAEEFSLSTIYLEQGSVIKSQSNDKPSIVLITKGVVTVLWKEGFVEKRTDYQKGNSILIPAKLGEYQFVANEDIELYKADIP
ncbi:mannose-6-phosphate isomerase, class I [Bacteroidota bacterium]